MLLLLIKVSDATKKGQKDSSRTIVEDDSDLYENNRAAKEQQVSKQQQQQRKTSRTAQSPTPMSQPPQSQAPNKPSPLVSSQQKPTKDLSKQSNGSGVGTGGNMTSTSSKKPPYRVFIALFDYDPFKMSPNTDSCQEELPFKEGQLIKVYGKEDDDGFFYGEANGRSGYIPCNMVSELQADDPEVVKQLLLSEQQAADALSDKHLSSSKTNQKKSNTSATTTTATSRGGDKSTSGVSGGGTNKSLNKQHSMSKSTKQDGGSSQQQQQQQQFAPINETSQYVGPQSTKPSRGGQTAAPKNLMVALYDYDPQSLSPNVDADVSTQNNNKNDLFEF